MRSVVKWAVSGVALIAIASVACGSSGGGGNNSGFTTPTNGDDGDDSSGMDGSTTGTNLGGGDDDGGGGGVLKGGTADAGPMEAGKIVTVTPNCSGTSAAAMKKPVNLVVVLDQSWSMGDDTKDGSNHPIGWQTRWAPVTAALQQFFEDPNSTGISASLTFFPQGTPDSAADNNSPMCKSDYTTPAVALTALPVDNGDDPFADAIDDNGPQSAAYNPTGLESDTPTKNALLGAYTYAEAQQAADPSAIYAVVLVTDGDPCGCDYASSCPSKGGTPTIIAAAATDIANNVIAPTLSSYNLPTYVIGIGPDGDNLNTLSNAGGTGNAIIVQTGTASTTSSQLITALDNIRTQSISCTYPIPPVPNGQSYDLSQVNVQYTAADGSTSILPYDPMCTSNGWHFDSLSMPTQVLLCGSTCTMLKADNDASVSVVFGCSTTTIIPGYDGGVTIR